MATETSSKRDANPASQRPAGVWAPALTPFQADLAPDARRMVRHCQWLLSQGCSGLAVFGTTSEANSLSIDEREQLLETLLAEGIPADRVIPGTGCCAISDSVRLTRHAVRRGCAGVLMLPPFYYKGVSDEGVFRNFAEVIERVADSRLRVYLYHIPQMSLVGFGPKLVERLLQAYPGVIAGMKDSSGDLGHTRTMLEQFGSQGFDVFVGSERFLLANLRGGGVGCITATGNVNPAAIARLYREWQSPDAERLQQELNAIRGVVEKFPVIPALKAIVAHHAADTAWNKVRPPLVELSSGDRDGLLAALTEKGFAMPGLRQ
jgi:4-hydroxy-tetrahydrodipicolinate synthase